ncbi:MAG: nitrogenase component 1 [Myxococcota bacterium]|nr:nitrogenase component 1 [Myxococcota bacterium]
MAARTEAPAEDRGFPYGRRLNLPYLIGVCLAANAVRDVWLVVDGPDCSHFKGQFIFGKHDWRSTLYRVDGRHRIVFTGTNAQNVTGNRDRLIARTIRKAMVDEAGAVLLTSMPLCGITGAQYDRIVDGIGAAKPVVEIPGHSLRGDWLDGFAETLHAIARQKALPRSKRRKGAIALVGYLMDRNEGDHAGNVAELARLLAALGLDLVSVWPGGGSWADLDRVARAGTIVSLPFGRAAARALAEKTGARLIETGVPVGIDGTRRWIEAVAESCGRAPRAKSLIAAEIDRIAARIARVIPFYFLNRGVAIVSDPHHLGGLAGLCADLGMRLRFAAAMGRESHAPDDLRAGAAPGIPVRYEIVAGASAHAQLQAAGLARGDLVICNGEMVQGLRQHFAIVEFGVPAYGHHVFTDTPFLGFEGALHLVNRMANALSQAHG